MRYYCCFQPHNANNKCCILCLLKKTLFLEDKYLDQPQLQPVSVSTVQLVLWGAMTELAVTSPCCRGIWDTKETCSALGAGLFSAQGLGTISSIQTHSWLPFDSTRNSFVIEGNFSYLLLLFNSLKTVPFVPTRTYLTPCLWWNHSFGFVFPDSVMLCIWKCTKNILSFSCLEAVPNFSFHHICVRKVTVLLIFKWIKLWLRDMTNAT